MSFISYAQNFEDIFLHRIFGAQQEGFYIDIGAYDPTIDSVTKALYDRGWCGINIEPGEIYEKLSADRPRDTNLRLVVLDYAGEVMFYESAHVGGMSGIESSGLSDVVKKIMPCDTLNNIISQYASNKTIDLLKIDVEGAEFLIISATNWQNIRPRLLIIESTTPMTNDLVNGTWEPILESNGYVRVYFDGINCFYVRYEDLSQFAPYFAVPINCLDDFQIYDHVTAAALAHWEKVAMDMQAQRDQHWTEMIIARAKVDKFIAEVTTNHMLPCIASNDFLIGGVGSDWDFTYYDNTANAGTNEKKRYALYGTVKARFAEGIYEYCQLSSNRISFQR